MGIEQASNQQLAVVANLAATENIAQVLQSDLEKRTETDNTSKVKESAIKQALSEGGAKAGKEILLQLAANLNQMLPSNRVLQGLKDEFGFALKSDEEPTKDQVSISSPEYFVGKAKKSKQDLSGGSGEGDERQNPQNQKQAVKEYIGAYSQLMVSGGSELKKKVEQLESQLLSEKGVSLKDLQGVKLQTANTVRSEILRQIKHSYLKQVCAADKSIDQILAKKEKWEVINFAFRNDKLGGEGFGGYRDGLTGTVGHASAETHIELRDFVAEKITEELVQKSQGKEEKKVAKDIDDLLKLGEKIGFNVQDFIAKLPQINDSLGLLPLIDFGGAAGASMENDAGQQERHRYQYTPEEEKEIMTDKLRALYLHRALHGDTRSVVETQFKMMKLQNGLVRLGVKNFDEVADEGRGLARIRLCEMLQEAFEERATYGKLSGPAWQMTEKKIKTVLRNLERLGLQMTQPELDLIRDKANEKMRREAEHELSLINAAIDIRGDIKFLTTKRKTLIEMIDRVSRESCFARPGAELSQVEEAV